MRNDRASAFCLSVLLLPCLAVGGVTYTWKDVDGDWSGAWSDSAHWQASDPDATDAYPCSSTATAYFPRGHAIAVTIDDNYTIATIDLSDNNPEDESDSIDVTLCGKAGEEYGTNKLLRTTSLAISAMNGRFRLDRAALRVDSMVILGTRRRFEVTNGSFLYLAESYYEANNSWAIQNCYGGTFLVSGRSYAILNSLMQKGSKSGTVIDDSTVYVRAGQFQHTRANDDVSGGTVLFRGTQPILRLAKGVAIFYRRNSGAYELVYTFEVPVGGYAEPPIQSENGTYNFPRMECSTTTMRLAIDPDSPCFTKVATNEMPLVSWPGTSDTLLTNKMVFATLDDGGNFCYGTSAAEPYHWTNVVSFCGTAKSIGARIVSLAHPDLLSVGDDRGNVVVGSVPDYGATSQAAVATDGKIAFSSPATYTADGTRYTCTGATLTEITKTESGSVTNVTVQSGTSFTYTLAGKEVSVVWNYTPDYPVEASAVNDANASVAVTKGTGYVSETASVELTASTTDGDMEFQYWYGDLPFTNRYANPLTLTGSKPVTVKAFFGRKAAKGGTILAEKGLSSSVYSWFDAGLWTGGVVPGTNDSAIVRWTQGTYYYSHRLVVDVPSFFAVRDLTISNAVIRINSTFRPANGGTYEATYLTGGIGLAVNMRADAADQVRTEPIGCDIFGDLIVDCYQLNSSPYFNNVRCINGGRFVVGGTYQAAASQVTVCGDVTVADGAISVEAGYPFDANRIDVLKGVGGLAGVQPFDHPDEFFRGRNFFRVKGKTTLTTPARSDTNGYEAWNVIQPICEFRTGVTVWLDFQDVEIQSRCAVTAYGGGYAKFGATGLANSHAYCMCPGGHCPSDNTSGGSYGGSGGSETKNPSEQTATTYVLPYGFANAPYYPGSPNGGDYGFTRMGGGSIRLDCQTLDLEGYLYANGAAAGGNKGGAAGGGIWVVCQTFNPGSACSVTAAGGASNGDTAGGGGGRVSICEGLTAEQVESLFSSDNHEAADTKVSSLADKLGTRFSAAGGTGSTGRSNGFDGTGVYIVNTAGRKTMDVDGTPSNIGTPTPAYGTQVFEDNTVISLSGPADAFVSDDNRSKRRCVGYRIADADGGLLVDSDEPTGSYTITEDCTLTWKMTSLVHLFETSVSVGGTIETNAIGAAGEAWQADGSTITLTAVPQEGFAFLGWAGEVATNRQGAAQLSFVHSAGRAVRALFATTAAGAVSWTGAGDGASWDDAANWSGGAVPGASSDVTIPSGANVTASFCLPVSVRNLTVEKGATLTFGPNGSYSTYAKPRIAENAADTDWQRISLAVSGDLTVNGTFTVGGKFSLAKFDLSVGGALAFGNGAKGNFYAAFSAPQEFLDSPTSYYTTNQADMVRASSQAGGRVTVGGLFSVAANAVVAPWCDFYSGASVRFSVGSCRIDAGGLIDADGKGWGYTSYSSLTYALTPAWRDANGGGYAGGTSAGLGGWGYFANNHYPSSRVFGWAYAPLLAGGPGSNGSGSPGGGVIRIHAKGRILCDGTMTAIGAFNGYCGGGGAIFLTSNRRVRTSETTLLTAAGRDSTGNGGGGGGRVMIGERLFDEDIDALEATGSCPRLENGKLAVTDLMSVPTAVAGTVTAKGGWGPDGVDSSGHVHSGGAGTALLVSGPPKGFVLLVH